MIRSSFASFNTAKMAIQANQSALAIVGQNMANVKTLGYTRQRLDQISLNSKNPASTYMSNPDAYIGYGISITGVSQIRDPFLDTRYRLEMSNLGTYDRKAELLNKLGMVFDETNRDGLNTQLTDLDKQLQAMLSNPSDSTDNMVRSSAQTLCGILQNYSKALKETQEHAVQGVTTDVKNVNDLLKQIQELNTSIKNGQVHGNPALELQDQRNVLIDELATYADIRVSITSDMTIIGNRVDELKIDYVDGTGKYVNLIDGGKPAGNFELKQDAATNKYELTVTGSDGTTKSTDPSLKGTFQSALHMINDAGEFDAVGATKGIPYYQKVLDTIATKFAETFNGLNKVTDSAGGAIPKSGDLFESTNGDPIDASNITLSKGWLDGSVRLVRSQNANPTDKDTTNIANMINALKNSNAFSTPGVGGTTGTTFFTGSFQECFVNMTQIQAMDQKSTETTLDNYISITNEIANAKDSVSGVNLDEEAMNMMQFNSALTAASRYMTTLDEALNTVINNMGVVGR